MITLAAPSKTFNLAAGQNSLVLIPDESSGRVWDEYTTANRVISGNAFGYIAAQAAYEGGEEWLEQLLEYISGNFDFIHEYCKEHIPQIKPNLPDATYLVWLDCRDLGMTNEELREFMIHKAGLGLNEGWAFGRSLSGYMRLNAACPRSVIEKALKQLETAVAAL